MVEDGHQFCGKCSKQFQKGESYLRYLVPTVEAMVEIDLCLDCRMKIHGKEMEAAAN